MFAEVGFVVPNGFSLRSLSIIETNLKFIPSWSFQAALLNGSPPFKGLIKAGGARAGAAGGEAAVAGGRHERVRVLGGWAVRGLAGGPPRVASAGRGRAASLQ